MIVISRKDAKAQGLKFYFTGEPCKNNHIDQRYVNGCACVSCKKQRTRDYTTSGYFKHHYEENREVYLDRVKHWAKDNPEKVIQNSKRWNHHNKERMSQYRSEFYSDPENKRQFLDKCKEYRDNHKAEYTALANK